MRPDIYTKAVLTLIAIMLTVIACKPLISPEATVEAQGPFAGIQFSADNGGWKLFDTRTGQVWVYRSGDMYTTMEVTNAGRITTIGKPPVK